MFAEALKRLPPAPEPIRVEEFTERQGRLTQQFRTSDILIVVAPREAVRSNDVHYRFRTSSDLMYLTGWTDPEATFVLRHDGNDWRSALFVQPKDTLKEIWEGRRKGTEGALENYAVDEAYPTDERNNRLSEWLGDAKRVFYRSSVDPALDALVAIPPIAGLQDIRPIALLSIEIKQTISPLFEAVCAASTPA